MSRMNMNWEGTSGFTGDSPGTPQGGTVAKATSYGQRIYRSLFKRTSTTVLVCVLAAFGIERFINIGGDYVFERVNRGKLWKDIKHNYVKGTEDEDADS